ncbi:outer membrane protein [Tabrizicola flagellatus]|uniref:outer membrane protein n=1 Tax=Tabrizicola flagellatus TaxID=2593021 RepID=UPI0011F3F81F|nr:outer membrane beta-barrel protein [Tabrizicola flagellatus]
MRKIALVATMAILGSPVFAGGPTVVAEDPVPAVAPAPAAAHDWSGPYVGLAYGRASGDFTYSDTQFFDMESGTVRSVFAGYLMQRGTLVYGGELAFSKGSDITTVGFPLEYIDSSLDLKGKVGLAANRALFYGVLGFSKVGYNFDIDPTLNYDATGLGYGIGMDYAVSNRITLGLEYMNRKTSGDVPTTAFSSDLNMNSLSLRVGLNF